MKWSDLTDLIAGAAPLIGGAVAGPGGAAVGSLLARAFGSEATPEAVSTAIRNDPQAALKLAEAETENRHELNKLLLESETARLAQVNHTMRTEATSDHWWVSGWRPFWGFSSALAWSAMVIAIGVALARGTPIDAELAGIAANPFIWGVPMAVLGIASWHRGKEKRLRVGKTGEEP